MKFTLLNTTILNLDLVKWLSTTRNGLLSFVGVVATVYMWVTGGVEFGQALGILLGVVAFIQTHRMDYIMPTADTLRED